MIEILYYDGKAARKGKLADLQKLKKKQIWIDVTDIKAEEAELLATTFKLHPLTKEDLKISITRVKIEEFPNYLFCVFYGIHKARHIELIELDFVLGKNFLITNHFKERPLFEEFKKDMEKVTHQFKKGGVSFIFHKLIDKEVDGFFPILESIDEEVTELDEQITQKQDQHILKKILKLKKIMVPVRKTVNYQRDKLSMLRKGEYCFISDKALPYFRDVHDHAVRVCDLIDTLREAVTNAFDLYMLSVSNRMNEIMKALSALATVALPLTVISSIYGTNFHVLPGSTHPFGFWIMIASMLVVSTTLLVIFKKKDWI